MKNARDLRGIGRVLTALVTSVILCGSGNAFGAHDGERTGWTCWSDFLHVDSRIEACRRHAEGGDVRSMYFLGMLLVKERELDTGVDWLARACREGEERACALVLRAVGEGIVPTGTRRWRGLRVEPENRCSEVVSGDYIHSTLSWNMVVRRLGGSRDPWTGECARRGDLDQIVDVYDAHDSGLCARDRERRRSFASDSNGLVPAAVHRRGDAADGLPGMNRCWYAHEVVRIKRKWRLSVDPAERDALESVLATCPEDAKVSLPKMKPCP